MRSIYYKKKRNRVREIDFAKVETIKTTLNMTVKSLSELLAISQVQYNNYKRSGKLPAHRYYAVKDALILNVEEEARKQRELILQLFGND